MWLTKKISSKKRMSTTIVKYEKLINSNIYVDLNMSAVDWWYEASFCCKRMMLNSAWFIVCLANLVM